MFQQLADGTFCSVSFFFLKSIIACLILQSFSGDRSHTVNISESVSHSIWLSQSDASSSATSRTGRFQRRGAICDQPGERQRLGGSAVLNQYGRTDTSRSHVYAAQGWGKTGIPRTYVSGTV